MSENKNVLSCILNGGLNAGNIANTITNCIGGNNDGFNSNTPNVGQLLLGLVVFVLVLVLYLYLGQYLWNNMLVKVVTVVKPVTSLVQLLGVMVLLNILKI